MENCHKVLTPKRLFPYVTVWVVSLSMISAVTWMQVFYVLESIEAKYTSVLEPKFEQMKKDALDKGVPIEKRREKADRYHKETNEKIPFLDETGKIRLLEPTTASKEYDKEFQEVQNSVNSLYRFLWLSGLANLLFAAIATVFYFLSRGSRKDTGEIS